MRVAGTLPGKAVFTFSLGRALIKKKKKREREKEKRKAKTAVDRKSGVLKMSEF